MAFEFIILFASTACYTPGLAQLSTGYAGAFASANAVSSGGIATANAYSYTSNSNGGVCDCTYNRCTPTCSLTNPQNCTSDSNPCNCPPGTIISQAGGQCVPKQQCDRYVNCKGDYNARFTDCPVPCPSTCATPNVSSCSSNRCGAPGCECKTGYIFSAINGKCIKPEECPDGYPCHQNETYINCLVECPSLYCPVSGPQVACGPMFPCPGRCTCKYNYLRKSVNDYTCVLTSECPPGICSGPNQEWNRCVSRCYSDSCKDKDKVLVPEDCPFSPIDCTPRCLCKKGFYRNGFTCVPVQECPPNNQ